MNEIEFRGFPIDMKFLVEEYDYTYRVQVWFTTSDRDYGKPMELFLYFSYLKENYSKAQAIRTALVEAMTHEIEECLYANGDRIFDPHDPQKLIVNL
jgi:hypothetical protein